MAEVQNTAAQPAPRKKSKFKKFMLIFTISVVIIWFIYYFICGMTYSDGTRSGILTKVSRKGFIIKTYEGEMNVGGFSQGDGTIMPASIFKFSVPDKKVYQELEGLQGHKVVLHYRQVFKNFFWQGETDYFIEKVTTVQ